MACNEKGSGEAVGARKEDAKEGVERGQRRENFK